MARSTPEQSSVCLRCGSPIREGHCAACHPGGHRRRRGLRRFLSRRALLVLCILGGVGVLLSYRLLRVSDEERFQREWKLAASLCANGEYEQAHIHLKRLRAEKPGNPVIAVQTAECLIFLDRPGEAEVILEEVLERSPQHPRANALLAHVRLGGGDWASARALAREAIRNGADDFTVRHAAGVAAYRLGLRDEAMEELGRAKSHDPGHLDTRALLATISPDRGAPGAVDRTVELLREAYEAGDLRGARYVAFLDGLGRPEEALRAAFAEVGKFPGEPGPVAVLLPLLDSGDEAEAERLFASIAEPGFALRRARAVHLGRQGRFEEALSVVAGDASREGALTRARLLRAARRPEEALVVTEAWPDDPALKLAGIHALLDRGLLKEAGAALAAIPERWPDRPDILLAGADALLLALERRGRADPEIAARIDRMLAMSGVNEAMFHACRARAALLGGDIGRARKLIGRVPARNRSPIVCRTRVRIALEEGRPRKAIDLALTSREPLRPDLVEDLAAAAGSIGRPRKTLELVDRAGPLAESVPFLRIRARALLTLSRTGEAVALLEGKSDLSLVLLRARGLRHLGRHVLAEEALGSYEQQPPARALLATWRIKDGREEEAEELIFGEGAGGGPDALLALVSRLGRSDNSLAAGWLGRARLRWPENLRILSRNALSDLRSAPLGSRAKSIRKEIEAEKNQAGIPRLGLIRGYFAFADGDVDTAVNAAAEAIAGDPGDGEAHLLMAYALLRRGEAAAARSHLETVLVRGPGRRRARGLIAYLDVAAANELVTSRDLPGAASALRRAVGRGPRARRWQVASARLHLARGEYEGGRKALEEIGLTEAAKLLIPAEELAVRLEEGDLAGALAAATRLTSLRPESPLGWLHRGRLETRLGKPESGLASFEKAYQAAPDWEPAFFALFRALYEGGQPERAASIFAAHLEAHSPDAAAMVLHGEIHLELGEPGRAAALAREALAAGGVEHAARELLVRAELALKGPAAAARIAVAFTREDAPDARALALAGRTLYLAGDVRLAGKYLLRAVDRDPDLLEARTALTGMLLAEEGAERAYPHALRAVEIDPEDAASQFVLGSIEEVLGRRAEALKAYEIAIGVAPRHPLVLTNLARLLAEDGDLDRALELSARAIEVLPDVAEVKFVRGYVLCRAGRADEALPLLRTAVNESSLPDSRAILVLALLGTGRGDEARSAYEPLRGRIASGLAEEIERRLRTPR